MFLNVLKFVNWIEYMRTPQRFNFIEADKLWASVNRRLFATMGDLCCDSFLSTRSSNLPTYCMWCFSLGVVWLYWTSSIVNGMIVSWPSLLCLDSVIGWLELVLGTPSYPRVRQCTSELTYFAKVTARMIQGQEGFLPHRQMPAGFVCLRYVLRWLSFWQFL